MEHQGAGPGAGGIPGSGAAGTPGREPHRRATGGSASGPGADQGSAGGSAPGPGQGRRRTQADRDAITVEIGYALFSGAFAAALVFGAVAGPAFFFTLPRWAERALPLAGGALAATVFVLRITHVLWRFGRRGTDGTDGTASDGAAADS
ncbi:DUF6332 family protein [Streptomyces sp. NPDC086023]|uniref:DUF6332 family protein n=1 Tax=Streptomyces sp. NPDC086023 TaxID=3365746 RepID=UPI0037CDF534